MNKVAELDYMIHIYSRHMTRLNRCVGFIDKLFFRWENSHCNVISIYWCLLINKYNLIEDSKCLPFRNASKVRTCGC